MLCGQSLGQLHPSVAQCALNLQTTLLHTTVCVISLQGSVEKLQMTLRDTHVHNYSFTPAMWRLHPLRLYREMRGSPFYALSLGFALSRPWFRDPILAGAYGPVTTC